MSSLFYEDQTLVLLQSFYWYLFLHCTSPIFHCACLDFSIHAYFNGKKCVIVQAVFYPNNVWESVVRSLFKILHQVVTVLSMKMIEHIVHPICVILNGRSFCLYWSILYIRIYSVRDRISLVKKEEAIKEGDQLFVMRHVFYWYSIFIMLQAPGWYDCYSICSATCQP